MASGYERILIDLINSDDTTWPEYDIVSSAAPTKVSSLLQILPDVEKSAISFTSEKIAIIQKSNLEYLLYIIDLSEKRCTFIWSFPHYINDVKFNIQDENNLLLASSCGKIFSLNINESEIRCFTGHVIPPSRINSRNKSTFLISWNEKEVLIWSNPIEKIDNRLEVSSESNIVIASYIKEKDDFVVCFDTGTVMVWDQTNDMKEYAVQAPEGVSMQFTDFSISNDGEWIVGGGNEPFLVTYSMWTRKVVQIVHVGEICGSLSSCSFLPPIHPQYSKVLLIVAKEGTIIMYNFSTSQKIKMLKSERYSIRHVSHSDGGTFLAVTYENGHNKIYHLASFLPQVPKEIITDPNEVQFKVVKQTEKPVKKAIDTKPLLEKTKWLKILEEFYEYPSKYRNLIWTSVLEIPFNYSILGGLLKKSKHPAVKAVKESMPNLSVDIADTFFSTLSCLYYWSPFLASVLFIPEFILNIVLLYPNNILCCFEISATIIKNWFRTFFENWPNPPENMMNMIEDLLCDADPEILVHLKKLKVSTDIYAWSLLKSGFKDVLSIDEFFILWDNILCNEPSFFISIPAAFAVCLKTSILSCSNINEVLQLYHQESWISAKQIVKTTHKLYSSLKLEESKENIINKIEYIPANGLPPFNAIISRPLELQNAMEIKNGFHDSDSAKEIIYSSTIPPKIPTGDDILKRINFIRKKQALRCYE